MKRIVATVSVIILMILTLCGCSSEYSEPISDTDETTSTFTENNEQADLTTTVHTLSSMPNRFKRDNALNYFRSLLNSQEQKVYDEWLAKIANYETVNVDFSTADITYEQTIRVTDALRADYPELWLYMYESYEYEYDYENNEQTDNAYNASISADYNWRWYTEGLEFDGAHMDSLLEQMNGVCDEIIARMPEGSYAEKYEFLAKEIAARTLYVDYSENDDVGNEHEWAYCYMNGPLLYNEGLCQAYAQAYQYLCQRAGLWCVCTGGGTHEWNVVKLEDGSTYHVDITWADTEDNGFNDYYFLMTQEDVEFDHVHEDKEYITASGKSLK